MGKALRESSGCPRGGADRAPSKTSTRRSGGKRPQGRRDGFAIALVGGYWAWPPRGSDLSKGLRGPSGRPRDDVGRSPPYNSARRSGGQSPQGRARRVCYSLGGGEGCGLRRTHKGARLFEGPHDTRGEVCTKARPKIVPTRQGPKAPRAPRRVWYNLGGGGGGGVVSSVLGKRNNFLRGLAALGGRYV